MPDGPERITKPLLDVLEALLGAEGHEMHGWAIMKTTGRAAPTIYKILERLSEANWVTCRWDDEVEPGKPRRRYYRLTSDGTERARALVTQRTPQPTAHRLRLLIGGFGA